MTVPMAGFLFLLLLCSLRFVLFGFLVLLILGGLWLLLHLLQKGALNGVTMLLLRRVELRPSGADPFAQPHEFLLGFLNGFGHTI